MNICAEGHDEIVYEGRYCPFCEMKREKEGLEERVSELETELNDARAEIECLKTEA